ncbi:hypothetical protein AYO21_07414 [Fonsecaea monophora]|uniref:SET domain-containing protein n=1 Tax=Fonsecaea monophora TaxID=254056 RepID=A0A177F4A1_9EURO|nr:hypothetical protein AYO21_07414 [Fonsecaea monophora]KAH0846856.1 hypothetical protein FOPE_11343 [Fonsecaea pedrosoi]OAG38431.1 hypothetical protein AYO21_07414 [Fonsecaea monophora]
MSSAQQTRRSTRVRKQTAKGRDYSQLLAQKAVSQSAQSAGAQAQATNAANTSPTNSTNNSRSNADCARRRSKRIRARVDDNPSSGTSNKRRRISPRSTPIEAFMIKLYAEIHHAATAKTIGQWDRYWTQHLLRQARTLRFFDLPETSTSQRLAAKLDKFESNDPKEKRVADLAKDDVDISHVQRLMDFCDEPSLLLLTICAHSKSFRDAIVRNDVESRAQDQPEWSQLYPKIKERASSLELFARTHKFEWTDALFAFNDHFEDLLTIVYKDCRDASGKDGANFGIGDDDLKEIHQIGTEDRDRVHYHWVLPVNDGEPAVWPSIKCTTTKDLTEAGFVDAEKAVVGIPTQGNNLEINPGSLFSSGSKLELLHFNIDQAIVLPNYAWPAETRKVVHPDGSVYEDPTFCGFSNNPCRVCGAKAADSNTQPQQQSSDLACQCTFADLCKVYNKSPQNNHHDILVELYTTAKTGRGVRALQVIPPWTYVGEYVGEIYAVEAETDDIPGSMDNHRYDIATYHMQVDIARAEDFETRTTVRSKKKGQAKGTAKTARATTAAAAATKTTKPDVRPQYTVDAAHRGGWTRYVNHSCSPNTQYVLTNVGQHTLIIVQALRRIAFGEEITVDYGDDYFENLGISCRCGSPRCKYKDVDSSRSSPSGSK